MKSVLGEPPLSAINLILRFFSPMRRQSTTFVRLGSLKTCLPEQYGRTYKIGGIGQQVCKLSSLWRRSINPKSKSYETMAANK